MHSLMSHIAQSHGLMRLIICFLKAQLHEVKMREIITNSLKTLIILWAEKKVTFKDLKKSICCHERFYWINYSQIPAMEKLRYIVKRKSF